MAKNKNEYLREEREETVMIQARIDPQMNKEVRTYCETNKITASKLIRAALRKWFDDYGRKK